MTMSCQRSTAIARVLLVAALLRCAFTSSEDNSASFEGTEPIAKPVVLDNVPTPSFAIILGRQRSGTSHLSTVLGQHPCVLNGNEIFTRNPVQDALGAHYIAQMSRMEILADPMRFLRTAHGPLCQQHAGEQCGGHCTIVFKLFDIHLGERSVPLLLADDTAVLVLERNPDHAYCSWLHATRTGDWGTTPLVHESNGFSGQEFQQCTLEGTTYEKYRERHDRWFSNARQTLHKHGKSFLEVPWNATTKPCAFYRSLLPVIYAHLGLNSQGLVIDDPSVAGCD